MSNYIDMTGKKIGSCKVIGIGGKTKSGAIVWDCMCSCGNEFRARGSRLRKGVKTACNRCNKSKHGMSGSPEYSAWEGMKARCTRKNTSGYRRYGGRGISVCERWSDFVNFFADMGRKPTPKHTLERIDNNGNYEPSNCKWALRLEQSVNQYKKPSKSGIIGVNYYNASNPVWRAHITKNNVLTELYVGNDFFEACCARISAENKRDKDVFGERFHTYSRLRG